MLATLMTIWCLSVGHALPIVDRGLFVIMGVSSCREGSGYCLLGLDCTLDQDFLPDDKGGHCNGLRSAFTPSANFICCRYNSDTDSSASSLLNATSVILDNHLMDGIPAILLSMDSGERSSNEVSEMENFTTEVYKTTTIVEEKVPKNVLEEESAAQVQVKSSIAKGTLSHLPSVTEINLELLVHDNIHERSVNNDTTAGQEGTSTMNVEELTTTETNVESRLADETVTLADSTQSATETNTAPSSVNTDLGSKATTELDLGTTEPIRDNEIPAEPEETKVQVSTTTSCSGTVGNKCWLVKFMNGSNIMCLGSFLSNNIILTAANCVARMFGVGLDAVTLQTQAGTLIPRNLIRDVIVHEEYNMKSTEVLLNDIGMVRLESVLKPTPSICTLCLPNSESHLMDKPCDTISKKYNTKKMLELPGSPMVCQGSTVGGVVSLYNPEPVYTPISDYLPWITHNMDMSNIPLEWQR